MNTPPLIVRIRVKEDAEKGFRLWLPFFLLFPLFYPLLFLVGLVFVVLGLFSDAWRTLGNPFLPLLLPFELFHALKGFKVDVASASSVVLVSFD